jgi:hypothetical protein
MVSATADAHTPEGKAVRPETYARAVTMRARTSGLLAGGPFASAVRAAVLAAAGRSVAMVARADPVVAVVAVTADVDAFRPRALSIMTVGPATTGLGRRIRILRVVEVQPAVGAVPLALAGAE